MHFYNRILTVAPFFKLCAEHPGPGKLRSYAFLRPYPEQGRPKPVHCPTACQTLGSFPLHFYNRILTVAPFFKLCAEHPGPKKLRSYAFLRPYPEQGRPKPVHCPTACQGCGLISYTFLSPYPEQWRFPTTPFFLTWRRHIFLNMAPPHFFKHGAAAPTMFKKMPCIQKSQNDVISAEHEYKK